MSLEITQRHSDKILTVTETIRNCSLDTEEILARLIETLKKRLTLLIIIATVLVPSLV